MSLPLLLLQFIVTAIIFATIEISWIAYIAADFYKGHIGHMMLDTPNLWAAACFYVAYITALLTFVVLPHAHEKAYVLLGYAALFALAAYGAFDFTLLALFKGWSWTLAIVDILWGIFLTCSTSWISAALYTYLTKKAG